ncbi:MAG: antitoxin Xre/MbcA/ParS toxin-binding domain-containing protein [Panacagrimonas sp.]
MAGDPHLILPSDAPASRATFSRQDRARMAKMLMSLFEQWGIDVSTQAELLGLSKTSRTAIAKYKKGAPLPDSRDLIDRVGNLFGIHKSLRLLYPHNRELVYSWLSLRNRSLDNRTPLEIMLEQGLPGIAAMRGYLDFVRGL